MSRTPPCADGTQAHRWRLATPTPGVPVVAALCRRCGAARTYRAYLDEVEGDWRTRPFPPDALRKVDCLPF